MKSRSLMTVNPKSLAVLSALLLPVGMLAGTQVAAAQSSPAATPAVAQIDDDPHAHHRAMLAKPQPGPGASTAVQLHDRDLLTQDGESVRFATDIVGDRIVVVDFVYTTCTTVCPVLSAIFGQMQERLGERLGREVMLVSLSVDPGRDTPARLKAYAARHKARPGWVWLTGDKTAVDQVLEGLGAYTPDFEDHPSMVLVGDGNAGNWTRFFGFPGPDQLMAAVDRLAVARQSAARPQ
jgi:protein SCO1/2